MTLRVTFVLPNFHAGGAQRVLLTFANGLDRSKFTPSIVVLNGQGPWKEEFASGLPVHDLEKARVRSAFPALVRALRDEKPDIVVSTMNYMNFAVLACRPWLDKDVLVFVREANKPSSTVSGPIGRLGLRLAYGLLYRHADRVISPSNLIRDELVRDYCIPKDLISVLRNPVDEQALRNSASQPRRHPGKGQRFVAVGRLFQQKGYDLLIQTMKEHGVKGHVTIFGEGRERPMLEEMISQSGLEDKLYLAGFNADSAPWVAGADALLLPSRWEGLPNVALEALALGTPVIAAPQAGGIGEIAAEAEFGNVLLVEHGAEFAAAMNEVTSNSSMTLRSSLLPGIFTKAEAITAFSDLQIREVAAS